MGEVVVEFSPLEVWNEVTVGGHRPSAQDIGFAVLERMVGDVDDLDIEEKLEIGLDIFENALDWRFGLLVLEAMKMLAEHYGRWPKRMRIVCLLGDVLQVQVFGKGQKWYPIMRENK